MAASCWAQSDLANWRYSELRQITAQNVARLAPAWSFKTRVKEGLESTPLALAGLLYGTASGNDVYALDLRDGRVAWHYVRPAAAAPSLAGLATMWGKVFLSSGRALTALDRKTGTPAWDVQLEGRVVGRPFATSGFVILALAGEGGGSVLCSFSAETGERQWRTPVAASGLAAAGALDMARDLLYWGTERPYGVLVLDPFSGAAKHSSRRGYMPGETAVVDGDAVLVPTGSAYHPVLKTWYVRHTEGLICRSWKFPLRLLVGALATAGGMVFAADWSGRLVALDAQSGKLLWSAELGAAAVSPPITYLFGGRQYLAVATRDGWRAFKVP